MKITHLYPLLKKCFTKKHYLCSGNRKSSDFAKAMFYNQNFTTMKKQTKAAAQAAQANQSATAQVTNAQAKAQAHSAYDADLLALFDATADKHTDVHTTLVDVRNASAKGTALGDLLRNKWSEIFCAALRNLPHGSGFPP